MAKVGKVRTAGADEPNAAAAGGRSDLTDPRTLPKLEFGKINKIRVKTLWKGTGREIREDLIATGGFSKYNRTKRQNLTINKPASMFEDTHQFNSGMTQTLRHPSQTMSAIVNELDTSFNTGYDEPGANMYQLQNIS